jgi:hypothetical protein
MDSKYLYRTYNQNWLYDFVLNLIYPSFYFSISPKYELPTVQREHDGPEDEGTQKYSMENEEVNFIYYYYIFTFYKIKTLYDLFLLIKNQRVLQRQQTPPQQQQQQQYQPHQHQSHQPHHQHHQHQQQQQHHNYRSLSEVTCFKVCFKNKIFKIF